ncbi:MAG: hypothetical protein H0W82_05445 [Actinobacteria bacterium]|nr:hypothetical protein [Actinomycetota bacterium]
MSDVVEILEGVSALTIPPGWELIALVGGDHDRQRFWSRNPPRTFRVVPEGDVYEKRDEGVWVAEGHAWVPVPSSDDQMALA